MARARSKPECFPFSLVIASAGAPAPRDTRRWLGALRWKPRLARRITGTYRRRDASRWLGAICQLMSRPEPARPTRHRERSKLECCASSLVTASAGMPAPHDAQRCFGVGCRSWHVAPRGARRRKEASGQRSALLYRMGRPQPARHGAGVQQARVLRLIFSDSERRNGCAAWHAALVWRWRL